MSRTEMNALLVPERLTEPVRLVVAGSVIRPLA
jgi:hypothetical protein